MPPESKPLIEIRPAGEIMVRITADGTIEYGENYTPDEAARLLWDAVAARGMLALHDSPREISDAEWVSLHDRLLARVREGCWCEKTAKPCPHHDAYDDGLLDLIGEFESTGIVKVALP